MLFLFFIKGSFFVLLVKLVGVLLESGFFWVGFFGWGCLGVSFVNVLGVGYCEVLEVVGGVIFFSFLKKFLKFEKFLFVIV